MKKILIAQDIYRALPLNRLKSSPFSVLFVSLLAASLAVFVPVAYADSEFAGKYRTYQAEVRAGNEAFDKKEYQSAIEHYSKAVAMSPFEAIYLRRCLDKHGLELWKRDGTEAGPDDGHIF